MNELATCDAAGRHEDCSVETSMSIMFDTNDSATGRQEGQLIADAVPNLM